MSPEILRFCVFLSVVIYFAFELYDRHQLKDEREELIRLKTLELVNKVTVLTLTGCALWYALNPAVNALYPLLLLVFSCLYTEVAGKFYFRHKY